MNTTPRHGHKPIKMRRVLNMDAMENVGDFAFAAGHTHISIALPTASDDNFALCCIPVREGPGDRGRAWGWNGNEKRPTITPSIHTHGIWHGWVRAGLLVEA